MPATVAVPAPVAVPGSPAGDPVGERTGGLIRARADRGPGPDQVRQWNVTQAASHVPEPVPDAVNAPVVVGIW